jgi:hypothetical protein
MRRVNRLVGMACKKERRISQFALQAAKDLFINDLLPDRRLNLFHEQLLTHPKLTCTHIAVCVRATCFLINAICFTLSTFSAKDALLFAFEERLKELFGQIVQASGCVCTYY